MTYDDVLKRLVEMQYNRNEFDFKRGTFRVKGDTIDVFPASSTGEAYRICFDFEEIDKIQKIDTLTGKVLSTMKHIVVFPATQYVISKDKIELACNNIIEEMNEQIKLFESQNKLIEAQRISERTRYDVELIRELGTCSGIENYSRHLNFSKKGAPPYTLIDYFPEDFLIIIDESHMTIPQIGAMYAGDRSRKTTLVEYGYRLPSALDNRPLNFSEFEEKINQMLFVSATPSDYEESHEQFRAQQIIRPTGLVDPEITVKPTKNQIDDLIVEINKVVASKEKVLIATLTKRMAEELTGFLKEAGIKVEYLHSDIKTLERATLIRNMRLNKFDVLVGINLLREGLDIPEISLVAILDADKEGFLRSETSLIQTVGRAARNVNGHVIMYADTITKSMKACIDETNRRRKIQIKYNTENNITPKSIVKSVREIIAIENACEDVTYGIQKDVESMSNGEIKKLINELTKKLNKAAVTLNFEEAAVCRDQIAKLNKKIK